MAALATAGAQDAVPIPEGLSTEREVKAAYLYNFARFVAWPPTRGRDDNFVVAVLGDDPFGPALDQAMAGKTIRGRPILVRRLARAEEAAGVDLLFISMSEGAHVRRTLKDLSGAATLTVSDIPDFVLRGGMVGFCQEDHTVRFDLNLHAVEAARLKVSSQLVRVARRLISNGS
jgi:hypothetical protein